VFVPNHVEGVLKLPVPLTVEQLVGYSRERVERGCAEGEGHQLFPPVSCRCLAGKLHAGQQKVRRQEEGAQGVLERLGSPEHFPVDPAERRIGLLRCDVNKVIMSQLSRLEVLGVSLLVAFKGVKRHGHFDPRNEVLEQVGMPVGEPLACPR